uniref:C2H2-type domain-containing protein n=1 Tax=Timema monikensis TaxID=170555 RepID=A0A7R9EEH9_9NEOP|nr:unnamed protein product [Timema monikensis]
MKCEDIEEDNDNSEILHLSTAVSTFDPSSLPIIKEEIKFLQLLLECLSTNTKCDDIEEYNEMSQLLHLGIAVSTLDPSSLPFIKEELKWLCILHCYTDRCGRYVANVVVVKLDSTGPGKPHLVVSKMLEATNSSTIAIVVHHALRNQEKFLKAPSRIFPFKAALPNTPLPQQPVLRVGVHDFMLRCTTQITWVVQTFDEEQTVAITESNAAISCSSVIADLAYVKSNYGNLLCTITVLEEKDLPLVKAVKIMRGIEENLNRASGSIGTAIVDTLNRVVQRNTEWKNEPDCHGTQLKLESTIEFVLDSIIKPETNSIEPASGVCEKPGFKEELCFEESSIDCFKRNSDVKSHQVCHSEHRPHKCDICGKCFKVNSILNSHLDRHGEHKHYRCYVCRKCFKEKGILKTHLITHREHRPHKCEVCGKCFKLYSKFKSHIAGHG